VKIVPLDEVVAELLIVVIKATMARYPTMRIPVELFRELK